MRELFERYYEESLSQSESQCLDLKTFELASRKYRWNYRRFFSSLSKDAAILDIGCGLGQFLYWLNKEGFHNITGIDISKSQVELALKLQPQLNIHHVDNPIDFLAQHPGEFSVITLNDVLEHMELDQLIPTMQAVHHALKDDGLVVIKTVNSAYPLGYSQRYNDLTHKAAFHEKSLTQLLRHTGFTDIHCYQEEIGLYNPLFIAKKAIVIMTRLLLKTLVYFTEGGWPKIISVNLIAAGKKKN